MANTILAIDDQDSTLGPFFLACQEELISFFDEQNITVSRINSNALNDLTITMTTAGRAPFVFGGYSHGTYENLLKSAQIPYISIALNGSSFENSLFYTFSCSSGKKLGIDLIGMNCICFIGYKADVAIWSTYMQPFVECANHGLFQFYMGNDTESIVIQMKQKYNEHIDAIYKKDYLIASILMDNRDALIKHGRTITLADLV